MKSPGPNKSRRYYLSASAYFALLIIVFIGLYLATRTVDYVWRWYRMPQYFYYQDKIEVRSEVLGEVSNIETKGSNYVVTITDDGGVEESYEIPASGHILPAEGDFMYPGDLIGYHEAWRVGILLIGLWVTLKVSLLGILAGVIIGMATGLARVSSTPVLKWSAITYIELIRGSPLLVQIFIWYFVLGTLINSIMAKYGLPQFTPIWFGVAALAFFAGAYVGEIVRAGIQSIHRGQMEAARSLGMTYGKAMRYVIMPQAMRRILPPLAGQFISLIKDSSLLGIIAIRELSKATREVVTSSLQPFELFFMCALLYLVLTFSLSMLVNYLERKAVMV